MLFQVTGPHSYTYKFTKMEDILSSLLFYKSGFTKCW